METGQIAFLLIDLLIGLGIGAVVVYFVMRTKAQAVQRDVDAEQARLLEEAQLKVKQMELAARDEAIKVRDEAELKRISAVWNGSVKKNDWRANARI
jgi:uncharacterized membrane protein